MDDTIPNIREYLNGLRRKLGLAEDVPPPEPGTERKAAAVLMPLIEREDGLTLLYTRRSDHLVSHRGQVAFPGGRFDPRDPDLMAAAMRETHEEVGIPPENIEVLGSFRGLRTHSTDILVTPFVGVVHGSPELRPDPKEVAEIFEVPLNALTDPRYRGYHKHTNNGYAARHPAILYAGQVIWGLTYSLTLTFLELTGSARSKKRR
jgi:8-oxo-dGTP pyrophosphatase MutT (NUDIX family)